MALSLLCAESLELPPLGVNCSHSQASLAALTGGRPNSCAIPLWRALSWLCYAALHNHRGGPGCPVHAL